MEYRSANEAPSLEQLVQRAKHLVGENIHDDIVASIYRSSHSICKTVVSYNDREMLHRSLRNSIISPLLHFPCGTTFVNIYKETKSAKWTFLSFAFPTILAIVITFLVAQIVRALGLM